MIKIQHISFLSLFIMMPIFVSFGSSGIGFDRLGGYSSPYYISLPISIFLVAYLLLANVKKLLKVKYLIIAVSYFVICLMLNTVFNASLLTSMAKTFVSMTSFMMLIYVFQFYFEKKVNKNSDVNKLENRYMLYPLIFILIVSFASDSLISTKSFIFENIKIYDFEQYFAFIFILLIGISFKLKPIFVIILCAITFHMIISSANVTASVLLLLMILLYFIFKFTNIRLHSLIHQGIIMLSLIFFIIFPFILFIYYDKMNISNSSIILRYEMYAHYLNNIQYFQVLFPFIHKTRGLSDMHNEFLEVFNAFGILGVFLYYCIVIKKLINFNSKYYSISISIALVIFLGGTMVENTLHPYTSIILAYAIAFYTIMSNKLIKINARI